MKLLDDSGYQVGIEYIWKGPTHAVPMTCYDESVPLATFAMLIIEAWIHLYSDRKGFQRKNCTSSAGFRYVPLWYLYTGSTEATMSSQEGICRQVDR